MKISVVTAVLNGESVIGDTLKSVASQRHPDLEHIVIDGVSTDRTLDVVRAEGHRIAKVISQKDNGVYQALNRGIAAATGDVILFLHAGDVYEDDEVLTRYAREFEDSTVDAVYADLLITDAVNRDRIVRRYKSSGFTPLDLASGFMPPHPTLAVRRAVYERLGGYAEDYRIAGDFDFCLRVMLKARIVCRYLSASVVRMPVGGISTRGIASIWRNTLEMKVACDRNGVDTTWLRLLSRIPTKWFHGRPQR